MAVKPEEANVDDILGTLRGAASLSTRNVLPVMQYVKGGQESISTQKAAEQVSATAAVDAFKVQQDTNAVEDATRLGMAQAASARSVFAAAVIENVIGKNAELNSKQHEEMKRHEAAIIARTEFDRKRSETSNPFSYILNSIKGRGAAVIANDHAENFQELVNIQQNNISEANKAIVEYDQTTGLRTQSAITLKAAEDSQGLDTRTAMAQTASGLAANASKVTQEQQNERLAVQRQLLQWKEFDYRNAKDAEIETTPLYLWVQAAITKGTMANTPSIKGTTKQIYTQLMNDPGAFKAASEASLGFYSDFYLPKDGMKHYTTDKEVQRLLRGASPEALKTFGGIINDRNIALTAEKGIQEAAMAYYPTLLEDAVNANGKQPLSEKQKADAWKQAVEKTQAGAGGDAFGALAKKFQQGMVLNQDGSNFTSAGVSNQPEVITDNPKAQAVLRSPEFAQTMDLTKPLVDKVTGTFILLKKAGLSAAEAEQTALKIYQRKAYLAGVRQDPDAIDTMNRLGVEFRPALMVENQSLTRNVAPLNGKAVRTTSTSGLADLMSGEFFDKARSDLVGKFDLSIPGNLTSYVTKLESYSKRRDEAYERARPNYGNSVVTPTK